MRCLDLSPFFPKLARHYNKLILTEYSPTILPLAREPSIGGVYHLLICAADIIYLMEVSISYY